MAHELATTIRKHTTLALAVVTMATAASLAPERAGGAPSPPLTRYPYLTDWSAGR